MLAVWAALLVAAIAFRLGDVPLVDPDEGRNAEVSREMLASGDFVVPHLDGLPYLDKPVAYFAAGAVSMAVLGPTELAARLPALLLALATALLAAGFGRHLYGREGAWTAGIATAAAPLTFAFARTVIFDSMLTFFVVGSIMAFYLAVEAAKGPRNSARRALLWTALAWACMGFGVLTKGPVALALPLLVAAPFAAWRRSSRSVWHPAGLVAFAVVVTPWVAAVSHRVPGFLHYALVTETFERLTTDKLRRTGPVWYFVPYLLAGALPWSIVALVGSFGRWRRSHGRGTVDPGTVFLALWIAIPFVFFSLSQSKRPQYILPLIPAVALVVAGLWARRGEKALPGVRGAAGAWIAFGSLLVILSGALGALPRVTARMTPELASLVPGTALAIGLAAIVGGATAWASRRRFAAVLLGLSFPVAALPVAAGALLEQIGLQRSTLELAGEIRPFLGADTQLVGVDTYRPSLSFYLRREIILSSDTGAELTSNYLVASRKQYLGVPGSTLQPASWWREALADCAIPRIFIVPHGDEAASDELSQRLRRIGDGQRLTAYGPCEADDGLDTRRPQD